MIRRASRRSAGVQRVEEKEPGMETGRSLTEFKRCKGKMNDDLPEVIKHLDGLSEASLADAALAVR